MLEQVDLSKRIDKAQYDSIVSALEFELGELQRQAKDSRIPIIILFEGWDAAGKGTVINKLLLSLDPRGFNVYSAHPPNEEESLRPFLWRFWKETPECGRITIFDRSWYRRVLVDRVDKTVKKKDWRNAYEEIKSFERQLVDDGYVIIKFFLHISKKVQDRRFRKLQSDPATAWRVTEADWERHRQYGKYRKAIEEMLAKTDTDFAPWTIVEAHDGRFATAKVFETTIATIKARISEIPNPPSRSAAAKETTPRLHNISSSILDRVDLSLALTREEYDEALKEYQRRIRECEHKAYLSRLPVVLIFEGWDAAGKGGNIRRLARGMDPRGYEVVPIGAPNDLEKAHHYLWRFWRKIPKAGHIAIFDRSWYGRVLVERVEGFCREDEWRRAYREINEMEEQLVNFGTALFKFWLEISKDEQLGRFQARQGDSHKQWKITEEDWRNREKWDQNKAAVDEMLHRTSTSYAPWTIVEANCKWHARIKTLKTVVAELEKRL